jgi:hypothetical protein
LKKALLFAWALLTLLLVASVTIFEIVPRYQTFDAVAASSQAIKLLRCVGRRPECLSSDWEVRVAVEKRCPGMPCLGTDELYEYKAIQMGDHNYVVARMKIPAESSAGTADSWFFDLDGESIGPSQCRDRTATAGVFRRSDYDPEHAICSLL